MNNSIKSSFLTLLIVFLSLTTLKAITELTDKNFETFIKNAQLPVIVDFYTTWCQPCQRMKPILEELEKKYSSEYLFASINAVENAAIADKYEVKAFPTFIIFNQGKEVWQLQGLKTGESFIKEVQSVIRGVSLEEQLLHAITKGDIATTQELLQKGANPNYTKKQEMPALAKPVMAEITPLTLLPTISREKREKLLTLLLENGANPFQKTKISPNFPPLDFFEILTVQQNYYRSFLENIKDKDTPQAKDAKALFNEEINSCQQMEKIAKNYNSFFARLLRIVKKGYRRIFSNKNY